MTTDGPAADAAREHARADDPHATRASSAECGAGDPLALAPGDRFDDFEIVSVLGRGGFGVVYLARQASLDRRIALKVSPCRGLEGRALARLDHPHIVAVHSQHARDGVRLLCMQHVPSVALDELLGDLARRGSSWNGADLLAAVDRAVASAAEFDPVQLEDRQLLAALDHVDAVCFVGSRLAAALGHAHRQGVLHRDVKPGNVLVSSYGRPLLVDFNMASAGADDDAMFGGTLPYMSPEHLAAFQSAPGTTAAAVAEASDQYSLGVLVHELAVGRLPFPPPRPGSAPLAERVAEMAGERRRSDEIWDDPFWREEPALASVLRRALAADPVDRWPSCDAFAAALDDVLGLRRALAVVRRENFLPAWCRRHPFVALGFAGILPNVVGTAVNVPYHLLQVVPEQHETAFIHDITVYNAVVYPACTALFVAVFWPILRAWRGGSAETAARVRARVLRLPRWAERISLVGWLPAACFFPWALHARAVELPWSRVAHVHVAILVAALIALAYSALLVLCVVAFVLYPALWDDPAGFRRRAADEVRPLLASHRLLPFLAGSIPLVAAVLLVTASPRTFADGEYEAFRLLTTLMIGLGMAGFQLARWAMARARGALEAFAAAGQPTAAPGRTGAPPQPSRTATDGS